MSASFDSKTIRFKGLYYDEYQAVYDAMTNKPSAADAAKQNALVKGLVDGGYWTNRMDLFYVFANHSNTAGEAYINWADPGNHTITEGAATVTFAAYQGFTGDGDSGYLDTNYNPSNQAVNFTLNSASVGVYLKTNVGGNYAPIGIVNTDRIRILARSSADPRVMSTYVNGQTVLSNGNIATCEGLEIVTRTASNATENYHNGVSLGSSTSTSNAIPNGNIYILAYNNAGTPNYFFPGIISIAFIMNGLTSGDVTAINTIIETYMDAIGQGEQP